jgi:hypothetical protein
MRGQVRQQQQQRQPQQPRLVLEDLADRPEEHPDMLLLVVRVMAAMVAFL